MRTTRGVFGGYMRIRRIPVGTSLCFWSRVKAYTQLLMIDPYKMHMHLSASQQLTYLHMYCRPTYIHLFVSAIHHCAQVNKSKQKVYEVGDPLQHEMQFEVNAH